MKLLESFHLVRFGLSDAFQADAAVGTQLEPDFYPFECGQIGQAVARAQ
jgi:hypothetical protein